MRQQRVHRIKKHDFVCHILMKNDGAFDKIEAKQGVVQ